MSYYQKYRPKRIEDLDLTEVRDSLLAVMKKGVLAHAYLLVGPRGSGKTSAARILAKVINCDKNVEGSAWHEPCGKCVACKTIDSQSAVDVMEMDAASHRGIDDIRDLRDKVMLAPIQLKKKVYIIDEVHMLTTEAFNALLKTLEEPPAHVVFFLCTTESRKIPETIVSRCVVVPFVKASEGEVLRSLEKVVEGERLKVADSALKLLAMSVDGSFREGHKLLEQIAVAGEEISEDMVRSKLHLVSKLAVSKVLELVGAGEAQKIGQLLDEESEMGIGAEEFVEELLSQIRESYRKRVGSENVNRMGELMEELIVAAEKIRISPWPYLPIEIVLTRAALNSSGGDRSEIAEEPREVLEVKQAKMVEKKVLVNREINLGKVEDQWNELLTRLTSRNHSVVGLLRSARPKEVDSESLTVEVYYKFHKEQLEMEARRKIIEQEVESLWGPLRVKCVLGEKAIREDTVADAAVDTVETERVLAQAAEEVFG